MTESIDLQEVTVGYEVSGPAGGVPVVAVHGWPDGVHCFERSLPRLHDAGCRVYRPWLRGFGPSRFRDGAARSGQIAALAQDLARFLQALDLDGVVVAGHDWGARAGYALGVLWPERMSGLVAMSVGYGGTGRAARIGPAQARAYWYQWFFATSIGHRALEADRRELCRYLWRAWSPTWQFTDDEFDVAATAFENPDWVAVTVHSYSQRWGDAPGDPRLDAYEDRLAATPPIAVPTIVLHGADDGATLPDQSADRERYFTGPYQRRTLPGVGHFVPREAPDALGDAVIELLAGHVAQ